MPRIIHIQDTDSTNNYLKSLLPEKQLEEGTVVFADFQTSGKGQRGNSWESERGRNIMFSIVFYPSMVKSNEQFIISQIVSLAVADALKKYVGDITIKWPNDIYWRERKICGMLIENTLIEDSIGQSVAGIGININQEKFESDAPNPVSLRQITGGLYNLKAILEEVVEFILKYYDKYKSGDKQSISESYKNSLFRGTGYYPFSDGYNNFVAKIRNIEDSGLLVLETESGEERKFAFKEVKFLL